MCPNPRFGQHSGKNDHKKGLSIMRKRGISHRLLIIFLDLLLLLLINVALLVLYRTNFRYLG